jgi:hypothetical protein
MQSTPTSEALEAFSPEDLETLSFESEALQEVAEELEEESVENLEDLEFYSESATMEAQQEAIPFVILGRFAAKYLLRVLIKLALRLITRIAANATLRRKVVEVVGRGGRPAFCRLLCQALCRNLPPVFRPLCNRLCPTVCQRVAPIAARRLGVAI